MIDKKHFKGRNIDVANQPQVVTCELPVPRVIKEKSISLSERTDM
jgi:hypothetical protein